MPLCQKCWHAIDSHPGAGKCNASTTFSTGHKNACRCTTFVAEHVRPVDSCDNCFATLTAEVEADAKLCAECLADELALDFAQEQAEERSRERARGER